MKKNTKYLKTEAKIKQAINDLLKKKILNVKVTELCRKAKIYCSTFYRHYHNINSLVDKTEEELLKKFHSLVVQKDVNFMTFLFFIYKNQGYFKIALERDNVRMLTEMVGEYREDIVETWPRYDRKSVDRMFAVYSGEVIAMVIDWEKNGFNLDDISWYARRIANLTDTSGQRLRGFGLVKSSS